MWGLCTDHVFNRDCEPEASNAGAKLGLSTPPSSLAAFKTGMQYEQETDRLSERADEC